MGILSFLKDRIEKHSEEVMIEKQKLAEQKRQDEEIKAKIRNGENMPIMQPIDGLILQKNEVCHCVCLANRQESKKETVGYEGGYSGVSLKVSKNVSLRSGGTRSHAVKKDVVHEYQGAICITNKRVVFLPFSEGKGFAIPLRSLIGFSKQFNGYIFHKENNSYSVTLGESELEIVDVVLTGALKNIG